MTTSQLHRAAALTIVGGLGTCTATGILLPFYVAIALAIAAMPWILKRALRIVGHPRPGDLPAAARILGWYALVVCTGLGVLVAGGLPGMNPDAPRGRPAPEFAWELAPYGIAIGAVLGLAALIALRLVATRVKEDPAPVSLPGQPEVTLEAESDRQFAIRMLVMIVLITLAVSTLVNLALLSVNPEMRPRPIGTFVGVTVAIAVAITRRAKRIRDLSEAKQTKPTG